MSLRTRIKQFFCRHSWAYFAAINQDGYVWFWKQCPHCLKHVDLGLHEYIEATKND